MCIRCPTKYYWRHPDTMVPLASFLFLRLSDYNGTWRDQFTVQVHTERCLQKSKRGAHDVFVWCQPMSRGTLWTVPSVSGEEGRKSWYTFHMKGAGPGPKCSFCVFLFSGCDFVKDLNCWIPGFGSFRDGKTTFRKWNRDYCGLRG